MWYQPCCSLSEVFGRKTEVLDILFVLILKKIWALTLEVGENKWRLYEKWVIWPLSALQGQRRRYLVPEIRATVTRTQVMCVGGSRSLSHCVLPCWGLPGPVLQAPLSPHRLWADRGSAQGRSACLFTAPRWARVCPPTSGVPSASKQRDRPPAVQSGKGRGSFLLTEKPRVEDCQSWFYPGSRVAQSFFFLQRWVLIFRDKVFRRS